MAKLSPAGQHLWSTCLGGDDYDSITGIVTDRMGNIFVAGWSNSYSLKSWLAGGVNTTMHRVSNGFTVKFSHSGQFLWGSFMGGNADESLQALAVSPAGQLYGAGGTASTMALSGYQPRNVGGFDGFIAELGDGPSTIGTVHVTLAPDVLASSTARWRPVGTALWLHSGEVIFTTLDKPMEIEVNDQANWIKPANTQQRPCLCGLWWTRGGLEPPVRPACQLDHRDQTLNQ